MPKPTVIPKMTPALIKMGNDESHLNVSFIVRDKFSVKTVSTDHQLLERERLQLKRNRVLSAYLPNALHQGQAGSRINVLGCSWRGLYQ